MKVFIADDSGVVRERLKDMLSEIDGIKIVGQAAEVGEAIGSIKNLKPDLAILDIKMIGGSGITILKEIKKIKSAPVVIMLTNYPYPQYRKKCIEAGADYFFDKSTEFDRIIDTITRNGLVKQT